MLEEMKVIEDNKTWELTTLPVGHRPIGLKWVYRVMRNEADEVMWHKAHMVAKGYVQCASIDFDKVFAPVAHLESVRLMLALADHDN
jgi:hypothetical protein